VKKENCQEALMFKTSGLKKAGHRQIETSGPGMRKWLLLDRPERIDRWITHFLSIFVRLRHWC
jgi:hypothetical protein